MANSDTIFALNGFGSTTPGRNQLQSVTALGTTATLLTMGSDTSGTTPTAFLPIPGQASIFGASNPLSINANGANMIDQLGAKAGERNAARPWYNQLSFDARSLRIRLQGKLTSSAASNGLTCIFYINTVAAGPVTAGAGTIATIATAASIGNAVSGNFIFEAGMEWDSVSNLMQGTEAWGCAAGVYVTRAVGNAIPFTVTAPISNYLLFASLKFATGASNVFSLSELSFEDV
jgi:hypothetical protein